MANPTLAEEYLAYVYSPKKSKIPRLARTPANKRIELAPVNVKSIGLLMSVTFKV